jgi:hypothetical protein
MRTEERPIYDVWSPKWRVLGVTLTADEHAALNRLAARERREKADMAALLIILALEARGLLPKETEEEPF